MMDRLRQHLITAHGFTADTWRLEQAEMEHKRDHGYGVLQHPAEDLYLAIDEDGDTTDPTEGVSE